LVKTVRIGLEDIEHEEFRIIKGSRTWYDVLLKGIKKMEKEEGSE